MKTEINQSNYEKMKNSMAEVFLQYDQDNMIRKFQLEHDERYLYIRCLERPYRVSREAGQIDWSEDGFQTVNRAGYNETMTIYDVLCSSKDNCHLAGKWVSLDSLFSVMGGSLKQENSLLQHSARIFEGKTEALSLACEKLGGKKQNKGDAAYELPLFPFLPIMLCFWDSDEEFPSSLQILPDQNVLDYMHYETLMFAVFHLIDRLKALI